MTEAEQVLGRRALEAPRFKWMPGMVDQAGNLCMGDDIITVDGVDPTPVKELWNFEDVIPDITQPSTQGCLLALVREARRRPYWQPSYDPYPEDNGMSWSAYRDGYGKLHDLSYAEALICALESCD